MMIANVRFSCFLFDPQISECITFIAERSEASQRKMIAEKKGNLMVNTIQHFCTLSIGGMLYLKTLVLYKEQTVKILLCKDYN